MSCSCGGQVTKVSETANGQKLSYQKCPSCGRCDGWSLKTDGKTLPGEDARRFYRARIAGEVSPMGDITEREASTTLA